MAAGEHQPQPVVGHAVRRAARRLVGGPAPPPARSFGAPTARAAQPVERAVARGVVSQAPGAAGRRRPASAPAPGEGVLGALLGEVPVAGEADQRRRRRGPTRRGTRRRPRSRRARLTAPRTAAPRSCRPAPRVLRRRPRSPRRDRRTRSGRSPAICSLVSANGPSDEQTSPSRTRTVVASVGRPRAGAVQADPPAVHLLVRLGNRHSVRMVSLTIVPGQALVPVVLGAGEEDLLDALGSPSTRRPNGQGRGLTLSWDRPALRVDLDDDGKVEFCEATYTDWRTAGDAGGHRPLRQSCQ